MQNHPPVRLLAWRIAQRAASRSSRSHVWEREHPEVDVEIELDEMAPALGAFHLCAPRLDGAGAATPPRLLWLLGARGVRRSREVSKELVDDGDRWPEPAAAIIWRGRKLDLRLLLARPLTERAAPRGHQRDRGGAQLGYPKGEIRCPRIPYRERFRRAILFHRGGRELYPIPS